ncbi:hypothetical protein F5146DRAFT_649443 [Armillaria mellea]|nr:hypothetical protein F5146DRAFT_649443 [Armillaria mellea]
MADPRSAGQPEPDLEAAPDAVEQFGGAQEKPTSIGIRRTGTTFGIHKKDTRKTGGDPTDYTKRYEKDAVGQEMSSRGRFWLTYLDEALAFDEEMVEMHKDNIDVLLVSAGLFSAILSTFVIQTAQNLQPDYTAASASLLIELVGYQRAASNLSSIPLSPFYPAISFSPSLADVWINSLWFFSLALSLTTALVAVLTKQWLHQYISVVSDLSPLGRGRIRQYRYMGLEKWQVPMIIGLLPILLHISLGLFFTGLCIYLFSLHVVIAYTVASLSGIVYAAYLIFLFLPLFHYNCPYKTPLMDYLFSIYCTIYNVSRFICCRGPLSHNAMPRTTRDAERRGVHMAEVQDAIDAEAISWLHSTSSNTSVQRIALEAALGIHLAWPFWECQQHH